MALFDNGLWVGKLRKLSNTQQSIQTVSQWALFYSSDCQLMVEAWHQEFLQAPADRKLTLLNLCNDIIQMSRKESNNFSQVFAPYLAIDIPSFVNDSVSFFFFVLGYVIFIFIWLFNQECTDHQRSKINRLMDIWVDRALYDANFIQSIKSAFHVGNSYGAPNLTLDSFSRVSASAPQSSAAETSSQSCFYTNTNSCVSSHSSNSELLVFGCFFTV
eukprot:TRINITY_DN5215_c0_g2_i6.p1 TRINITY_DN5215_c0_g2~~TRINITY_DN5215_c0_g2_i6.p1  ORF type:complete len:216 (-),score=54.35 TRINITY_DN5215_c0_g2_i6:267-914(-)